MNDTRIRIATSVTQPPCLRRSDDDDLSRYGGDGTTIWQDLVFLAGSAFSIVVLAPTLTDRTARIPLGTSLPSALTAAGGAARDQ
ncbi:hypothetical protein [Halorussus marinus]|uniref:hypothetical protein n=1 Tax=Halorussus marinus TaxID=2505976 RepID=UPI00106E5198|nr:hypothetical protein [Halorussus marinus]